MKRVKIMLLSFTLLAVIGGALAFKAKYNIPFCYTLTYSALSTTCPSTVGLKDDAEFNTTIYTTTANAGTCSYRDGNQTLPLTCTTATISSTFD